MVTLLQLQVKTKRAKSVLPYMVKDDCSIADCGQETLRGVELGKMYRDPFPEYYPLCSEHAGIMQSFINQLIESKNKLKKKGKKS